MSLTGVPSGHFLSLPPSFTNNASDASNGLAPNTASLASADFDVDVRTGFLPGSANVERLEGEWSIWEDALDAARGLGVGNGVILGGKRTQDQAWRAAVQGMDVLATAPLAVSIGRLRRAHLVLAFLAHFYVHTSPPHLGPTPVPESISIPLLAICPLLGLPPVVTYADTVLYNVAPASGPITKLNPPTRALTTFTNTVSEEQFYIISAQTEHSGAEALKIMRQSLDELFLADAKALKRLAIYLRKLAVQIDKIGDITLSMMQHIDPEEFYHLIRPWFRGGDSAPPNVAPAGWAYLGAPHEADAAENSADRSAGVQGRLFSGPSAGQSSLIHAIDIFLTVDHSAPADQPNEATFVSRMKQYMPAPHRAFLTHLDEHPTPLRPLVAHYAESHPALAKAYDGALDALKRFREKHMRIVSMFIVQQARRQPSERIRKLIGMEGEVEEVPLEEMRGTGGSPLFKFLKRCRDNTTKAMIRPNGAGYDLS
jgi:indoleamine 2,3-dioxygenase